jgi:hypothetical protein
MYFHDPRLRPPIEHKRRLVERLATIALFSSAAACGVLVTLCIIYMFTIIAGT